MLKEKLNKILKNDGNNKKKTENLVFLLIILIVTVIAINTIWKEEEKDIDTKNTDNKKMASNNVEEKVMKNNSLEEKLEYILSNITGVGKVDVLITYNETEEIIPVYNKSDKKSVTSETDSSGGTRKQEDSNVNKEVIIDGNNEVITQTVMLPKVEGAIVIAEGGGNAIIKANIIQAVSSVTGVATYKVQVFEMKK